RGRYTAQVVLTLLMVVTKGPLAAKSDTAGKPVPGCSPPGVPGLVAMAPADSIMPREILVSIHAGSFISSYLLVGHVGIWTGNGNPLPRPDRDRSCIQMCRETLPY